MFHVKQFFSDSIIKRIFLLIMFFLLPLSCVTPRQTIQISDYILLENGKKILGNEGLTAFVFENNPRKIPFNQFLVNKFNLPKYIDVSFWVTIDGNRYQIFLYENHELEKYFKLSDYMVSNVEPDMNIIGSKAKFIGLSMISSYNEDCLKLNSLYQNIAIKYLKNLKDEYNNL